MIWAEPTNVAVSIGNEIHVKAMALDTLARVQDITFDSRWDVRDDNVADLDQAGMMLHAMGEGATTLHVSHDGNAAVVPVAVFK